MIVYMVILAIASLPALSSANPFLRNNADRTCRPEQTCSYFSHPYTFQLCVCPGGKECPEGRDHIINQDGIDYHFCGKRPNPPICGPNEVATSVENILTSIHCICPEGMVLDRNVERGADGIARFYCTVRFTQYF